MTPEERRLINDLFDRMNDFGNPEKDREAEALINQRVRAMPDAPYMLTQSVLVQEQALETANQRVMELEDRVRELEDQGREQPRRSGSFLGNAFGLGRREEPEPRPSSVPQVGSRSTPSAYDSPPPWQPSSPHPPAPASSGGGFMRSAMATAAGVAGGVLVAESIRNMMGSGHAKAAGTSGEGDKHDLQTAAGTDNDPGAYDTTYDEDFDSSDPDDTSIDI